MTLSTPLLEVVALFSDGVPKAAAIAGATTTPVFEVHRLQAPFGPLAAELADPLQPLIPDERAVAAAAVEALHLRCAAEMQPAARLGACVERIDLLRDLGAVAIVLPAAHKVIGPTALDPLLEDLTDRRTWLKLFTHEHVVRDDRYAWFHTHGMEHFGLPDVECRTLVGESRIAQSLIAGGIHQLVEQGPDSFHIDDLVEAIDANDAPISRFRVRPYRHVPDHAYGFYGCIQLVPEREPR